MQRTSQLKRSRLKGWEWLAFAAYASFPIIVLCSASIGIWRLTSSVGWALLPPSIIAVVCAAAVAVERLRTQTKADPITVEEKPLLNHFDKRFLVAFGIFRFSLGLAVLSAVLALGFWSAVAWVVALVSLGMLQILKRKTKTDPARSL